MRELCPTSTEMKQRIKKWTSDRRSRKGGELIGDRELDLSDLIWPQEHNVPGTSSLLVDDHSPPLHHPIPVFPSVPVVLVGLDSLPAQQDRDSTSGTIPLSPLTLHTTPTTPQVTEAELAKAVSKLRVSIP